MRPVREREEVTQRRRRVNIALLFYIREKERNIGSPQANRGRSAAGKVGKTETNR